MFYAPKLVPYQSILIDHVIHNHSDFKGYAAEGFFLLHWCFPGKMKCATPKGRKHPHTKEWDLAEGYVVRVNVIPYTTDSTVGSKKDLKFTSHTHCLLCNGSDFPSKNMI